MRDYAVYLFLMVFVISCILPLDGIYSREDVESYSNIDRIHFEKELRENKLMSCSCFTENRGQIGAEEVLFYSNEGNVFFMESSILFRFNEKNKIDETSTSEVLDMNNQKEILHEKGVVIKYSFTGANEVKPFGREQLSWRSNFLFGNDSTNWHTQVSNFREIVYPNLWNGIDLIYKLMDGSIKYDLIVHPGADPSDIAFILEGHSDLSINNREDLIIGSGYMDIVDSDLVAYYQDDNGNTIDCSFRIDDDKIDFDLGEYDSRRTLVIDPLIYSTYIGGISTDYITDIFTDEEGYAYVTGWTNSNEFPVTPGSYDTTYSGGDIFITKINKDGKSLKYSTFIGGNSSDRGNSLTVDNDGCVYLTGLTESEDFPTTVGANDTEYHAKEDVFILKMNRNGTALNYSTFLGSDLIDIGHDIVVDDDGYVFVTGATTSQDFPTTDNAFDEIHNSNYDVFVLKLNQDGSTLLFSTFLGSEYQDYGYGISLDDDGNTYITGMTTGQDFPTTPNAYDQTENGNAEMFVTKLNKYGSALVFSTYLGGSEHDVGDKIGLDDEGCVYVTGHSLSLDFPTYGTVPGPSNNGDYDGTITKLSKDGGSLIYSTYIGGRSDDWCNDITLDEDGYAYVVGITESDDLHTTSDALSRNINGAGYDGFVLKLHKNGKSLIYFSYIGGKNSDSAEGIAIDGQRYAYLAGDTSSANFPTSPNAFDTEYSGVHQDSFITKISIPKPPGKARNVNIRSGDSYVEMEWLTPEEDGWTPITNYNIYRSIKPNQWNLFKKLGDVRIFNDTSVTNGQRYYYSISAENDAGEGVKSEEFEIIPKGLPSAPLITQVKAGNNKVFLKWSPPESDGGSGILRYNVYRSMVSGGESLLTSVEDGLNYTDEDVTNGQDYYYQVSAVNSLGTGQRSNEVNSKPVTVPSIPLDFQVTCGNKYVYMSWSPPESDGGSQITKYLIHRRSEEDNGTFTITVADVLFYNDTDVTNGITYFYRISASNSIGAGTLTGESSTTPATTPSEPRDLLVSCMKGRVHLSWSPPYYDGGSPIIGYNIFRGMDPNNLGFITSIPNILNYTDKDVVLGCHYFYQVTANNSIGEGQKCLDISIIPRDIPGQPRDLKVNFSSGKVILIWYEPLSDGGSTITNYVVFRGFSIEEKTEYEEVGNELTFSDSEITYGQVYFYWVCAVNEMGPGLVSEEVSILPVTLPSTPSNLQIEPGNGEVMLSWSVPRSDGGSPITYYRIYRSTNPDGEVLISTIGNSTNFTDSEVTNGQRYYYKVSSVNLVGEGPTTEEVSAIPSTLPSKPLDLQVQIINGAIQLSWSPPSSDGGSEIIQYNIYRGLPGGDGTLLDSVHGSLKYTDYDYEKDQTYYYRISAVNSNGEGEKSDQQLATVNASKDDQFPVFYVIVPITIGSALFLLIIFIFIRIKVGNNKEQDNDLEEEGVVVPSNDIGMGGLSSKTGENHTGFPISQNEENTPFEDQGPEYGDDLYRSQ